MTKPRKKPAPAGRAANPVRGEHEIVLAGTTYLLRPSYAAQVAIEAKTGKSYAQLAQAGQTGGLFAGDAAIALAELINAGAGNNPLKMVSAERIGELIYEEGLPTVAARLTMALIDALTGGRTASGEAKAAAARESA